MSWMDSWSRPGNSQATPAPYYLLAGGEETPYCRSCGRVVSTRKINAAATKSGGDPKGATPAKYCSARCRNNKPGRLDREIEAAFVRMLEGQKEEEENQKQEVGEAGNGVHDDHPPEQKGASGMKAAQNRDGQRNSKMKKNRAAKGDPRILVSCDEVERRVFGDRGDPEKTFGRKKNRTSRALPTSTEEEDDGNDPTEKADADGDGDGDSAIALEEDDVISEEHAPAVDGDVLARMSVRSGTRVRPPQSSSEVNGSVGGEKGRAERAEETEEMARRRLDGLRRAQQKEMVRSAARRGIAFGFVGGGGGSSSKEETRRKCEAVMLGKVVEPSFAKGNWGIRWRE
ncbi:hypothetical protein DL764_007105 [Monosporascus ibericus]|uniref:Uncharacterized protein n=1 Tax=Monosporascus ibericus TaxID=155417 RepID=A0A4Q4T4Z0_9PEZI|nr:hypothetical protein DL764_007105 [Monosporascus ibericus]